MLVSGSEMLASGSDMLASGNEMLAPKSEKLDSDPQKHAHLQTLTTNKTATDQEVSPELVVDDRSEHVPETVQSCQTRLITLKSHTLNILPHIFFLRIY